MTRVTAFLDSRSILLWWRVSALSLWVSSVCSSGSLLFSDGVISGRLEKSEYDANFSDLHPPLDKHEAMVAADRCYFCYDAPCITACPTGIDIPLFIRQISTNSAESAAKTIFDQNILGGMCARV